MRALEDASELVLGTRLDLTDMHTAGLTDPMIARLIVAAAGLEPDAELERRFTARAPARHPGHVDHMLSPEAKAALVRGVGPLRLGPVLEVDTTRPVAADEVAAWVRTRLPGLEPG